MTDKIDIHEQNDLSSSQCDIAIAIWRKLGVFDTESNSAKALRSKFSEEIIWKRTFRNFDLYDDSDCNKMKKFTNQIMERYKNHINYAGVARVPFKKGKEHWNLICKPSKDHAIRVYGASVSIAATGMVKAERTNDSHELGHRMQNDLMQRVEAKIPNLIERRTFYQGFMNVLGEKAKELDKFIELTQLNELPEPKPEEIKKSKEEDLKIHRGRKGE